MESLFHLIFELVKISLLACFYATASLVVFKIIAYYKPGTWFETLTKKKLRFWFVSGFLISIGLFLFMCSHSGDHGLGDSAKIPLGHSKEVLEIDGTNTFLQDAGGEQLAIGKFAFDSNNLYAETPDNDDGNFVVWNLQTDSRTFYKTKSDYLKVAKQNNYPLPNSFEPFSLLYNDYWHGWRFWLLP